MASKQFFIREAEIQDAAQLSVFGARTFEQAFGLQNTREDMQKYVSTNFNEEKIRSQLLDPAARFLLAYEEKRLVGYSMLREGEAPVPISGANPIELVRIYVDKSLIGAGYGSRLMEACINKASEGGHDVIWLGVWEENENAIGFYRKWGFRKVGSKEFLLGSDIQQDLVMERLTSLATKPLAGG
jgi:ribosomal protein S18 acetylase RimI-like enzyme